MWRDILSLWNYHLVWYARAASILKKWASAAVASLREKRWGKLLTWGFVFAILNTAGDFIKLGVTQTIALFRGVAGDSSLLAGGNLLSWASQSLEPLRQHAMELCPAFWRWLGYWIGFDWLVWAFVCTLIFSFCGWLLSILVKALATIIRLIFQFS